MYGHHSKTPILEQQQELLQGRYGDSPQDVQLIDRMEKTGATVEQALNRLDLDYRFLYFVGSVATLLGSLITFTYTLFSFSFAGIVGSLFLFNFGLLMAINDLPGSPRWAAPARQIMFRQFKFLSKVIGQGLWFLYLGCTLIVVLWNYQRGSVGLVLGMMCGVLICSIGVLGVFVGLNKSLRLERAKKQIYSVYRGNLSEIYRKYAVTDASHGILIDEFKRLCADYTHGECDLSQSDLMIIYASLDEQQTGAINEREFNEWVAGRMTYL